MPADHPPVGPAGAFGQIGDAELRQQQQERESRAQTPEDSIHRILRGEQPDLATAFPTEELPEGTIRVRVVDAQGAPVEDALVQVGILAQGGGRDTASDRTNAQGLVMFSGLETGQAQAYRVKVPVEGALFASNPFQLPPRLGYDVTITRLPTTRDQSAVMQLVSRTFLELRDERVHVVQQAQILNMAMEVYSLPNDGKPVRLPEGFTAFQSQPVMTDQRIEATDEGFLLRGSIPPGRTTLVWAYDLLIDGGELDIEVPVPFRTFEMRVESDAPPGLTLDVSGMPDPEEVEADSGRSLLITGRQFSPDEPQPSTIRIRVAGLPGPGPARWIALGGALVMFLIGFMFLLRRSTGDRAFLRTAREQRKRELLAEAAELERLFESSEIGPKYRARQMDAVVTELSSLLREEAAAKAVFGETDASADPVAPAETALRVGYNARRVAVVLVVGVTAVIFGLVMGGVSGGLVGWAPIGAGGLCIVFGVLGLVNARVVLRGNTLELKNLLGMTTKSWTLDRLDDVVVQGGRVYVEVDGAREQLRGVGDGLTDQAALERLRRAVSRPRGSATRKKKKKKK
jgi:hypothetical protein